MQVFTVQVLMKTGVRSRRSDRRLHFKGSVNLVFAEFFWFLVMIAVFMDFQTQAQHLQRYPSKLPECPKLRRNVIMKAGVKSRWPLRASNLFEANMMVVQLATVYLQVYVGRFISIPV